MPHTDRKPRLGVRTAFLIVLALLGGCDPLAGEVARPDLLLITIDTLRPDYLACYGGEGGVGTRICALAEAGGRFVWAFATSSSTGPSVASILTSRYPWSHAVTQVNRTLLRDDVTTVAEVLAKKGYATAAFVSNPVIARYRKLDQGFSLYDDRMNRRERNRPNFSERTAEHATDAAIRWLASAPSPWFLWVHYQDPHGPYDPPGEAASDGPAGGTALRVLKDQSGREGIPAYQVLPGVRSAEGYRARYLAEIRYVDTHVGRLLEAVDRANARPGVIITADHGEAFGEDDYWFAHGHSLGIDQIRVPLVWRPAGGTAPYVHQQPVSLLDLAPTLLAEAGIDLPEGFVGHALPSGSAPDSGREAFFAEQGLRVAVIEGPRYYGRDRRPARRPIRDPISSGWFHPLPPRIATLGADGNMPEYRKAAPRDLEGVVRAFLRRAKDGPEPEAVEFSPDVIDQLRALGYLE